MQLWIVTMIQSSSASSSSHPTRSSFRSRRSLVRQSRCSVVPHQHLGSRLRGHRHLICLLFLVASVAAATPEDRDEAPHHRASRFPEASTHSSKHEEDTNVAAPVGTRGRGGGTSSAGFTATEWQRVGEPGSRSAGEKQHRVRRGLSEDGSMSVEVGKKIAKSMGEFCDHREEPPWPPLLVPNRIRTAFLTGGPKMTEADGDREADALATIGPLTIEYIVGRIGPWAIPLAAVLLILLFGYMGCWMQVCCYRCRSCHGCPRSLCGSCRSPDGAPPSPAYLAGAVILQLLVFGILAVLLAALATCYFGQGSDSLKELQCQVAELVIATANGLSGEASRTWRGLLRVAQDLRLLGPELSTAQELCASHLAKTAKLEVAISRAAVLAGQAAALLERHRSWQEHVCLFCEKAAVRFREYQEYLELGFPGKVVTLRKSVEGVFQETADVGVVAKVNALAEVAEGLANFALNSFRDDFAPSQQIFRFILSWLPWTFLGFAGAGLFAALGTVGLFGWLLTRPSPEETISGVDNEAALDSARMSGTTAVHPSGGATPAWGSLGPPPEEKKKKVKRHPNLGELGTPILVRASGCCWGYTMILAIFGFACGTVLSLVALVGGDLEEIYAGYLSSGQAFAEFAEADIVKAKVAGRKSRLSDQRVSKSLETCLVHDGRLGASWELPVVLEFCRVVDFSKLSPDEAVDLDTEYFADLVNDAETSRGLSGENFLHEDITGLLPEKLKLTSVERKRQKKGAKIRGLWGYIEVLNTLTGDDPPWTFTSLAEPWTPCTPGGSTASTGKCRLISMDLPTDLQIHQAYSSSSIVEAFRLARLKEKFWNEAFVDRSPFEAAAIANLENERESTGGGEDGAGSLRGAVATGSEGAATSAELATAVKRLLPRNHTTPDGSLDEKFTEWVRRVVSVVREEHALLALEFNAAYRSVTEGLNQALSGPLERGRVVMRTLDCSPFKQSAWDAMAVFTEDVAPSFFMAGLSLCLSALALAGMGKTSHGLWRKSLFRFDAAVAAYRQGLDWRQAASEYARGKKGGELGKKADAGRGDRGGGPPGAMATF